MANAKRNAGSQACDVSLSAIGMPVGHCYWQGIDLYENPGVSYFTEWAPALGCLQVLLTDIACLPVIARVQSGYKVLFYRAEIFATYILYKQRRVTYNRPDR